MLKNKINGILKKVEWLGSSPARRIEILRRRGVSIGEGCDIFGDVLFGSEPYLITIGNNVRISRGVKFVTHDGGLWVLRNMGILVEGDRFGKIEIGNNVHIGWNAIIMPNVKIGDNVVVGCGAIVTKNIASNSVVAGVPARVVKSIDEYYASTVSKCDYTKNMTYAEKKKYLLDKLK